MRHRGKKFWLIIGSFLVLSIGVGTFFVLNQDNKPKESLVKSNTFTGEKPVFTVYYPSSLPSGITLDKGSIKTAKDLLSFNLNQNGKQNFSITEQLAGNDFDFKDFKKKLISAQDFEAPLGKATFGALETGGIITAAHTHKNTLIIINCVNTTCVGPSRQILENMKIVNDLSSL